MRRTIRLYFQFLSIQLRSQMQYRASFILDIVSMLVLNGSYFVILALVLERFGAISGWRLPEVAFLFGMAEMGFGMMDLFFSGFDPATFSTLVRMGQFDQILLRPVGVTVQVFGSRFVLRRLGRVLGGAMILAVAIALGDIHWTVGKVLYLPVVLISQTLGMGALFVAGATLTFWTIQPLEFVNIFTYGGNELMTYPMHIYPRWLVRFFTYVIPLIFLNFLPALYILDKADPLGFPEFTPFLAPLIAAWMLFLAFSFWRYGLKHYQSTGT